MSPVSLFFWTIAFACWPADVISLIEPFDSITSNLLPDVWHFQSGLLVLPYILWIVEGLIPNKFSAMTTDIPTPKSS